LPAVPNVDATHASPLPISTSSGQSAEWPWQYSGLSQSLAAARQTVLVTPPPTL
jgi:hypothetical protein